MTFALKCVDFFFFFLLITDNLLCYIICKKYSFFVFTLSSWWIAKHPCQIHYHYLRRSVRFLLWLPLSPTIKRNVITYSGGIFYFYSKQEISTVFGKLGKRKHSKPDYSWVLPPQSRMCFAFSPPQPNMAYRGPATSNRNLATSPRLKVANRGFPCASLCS